MSRQPQLQCDDCGRSMLKAQRRYKGNAYCSTCYAREFKKKTCINCGDSVRAHKYEENPVCGECVRQHRLCARCDKPLPRADYLIGNAAFCKSCASHVRKERTCSRCGCLSSRYSSITNGELAEIICQACERKACSFVTCSVCRKYRQLDQYDVEGRALCRDCSGPNPKIHSCPDCGANTPGGGSAPCPDCSLKHRLDRRITLNLELFEAIWCRELFLEFCSWEQLPKQAGNMTRRIDTYARFFLELERCTLLVENINQQHLFNLFGAEKLRRSFHVVNFLVKRLGIAWDNEEQEQLIEKKRISDILRLYEEQAWHREVVAYVKYLRERITYKETPIKPLSIRNYLRAAIELLVSARVSSIQELPEDAILTHSTKKPGHRASLTIFRTYAKEKYAVNLLSPEKRSKALNNKQQIKKAKMVMEKLVETSNDREARALLPAAISYLYQLPLKKVLMIRHEHLINFNGKVSFKVDGQSYELFSPLPNLIENQKNEDDKKTFIFFGRSSFQPLSSATVSYYIKKLEAH